MPLPSDIRIVDNVPSAFADFVAELAPRSLALSGGETARRCYEHLAVRDDVDYASWDVFFSDERWVPAGDPDSNEGMARSTLLDSVLPRNIFSMRHAGGTIEEAAANYDEIVHENQPIDLVHLGFGPDGHIASLFPNSPTLSETKRFVVNTGDDLHPHPRLTFTYPGIQACRTVVVTVEGSAKRAAFADMCDGKDLPASHIKADLVLWIVDHAVAGRNESENA